MHARIKPGHGTIRRYNLQREAFLGRDNARYLPPTQDGFANPVQVRGKVLAMTYRQLVNVVNNQALGTAEPSSMSPNNATVATASLDLWLQPNRQSLNTPQTREAIRRMFALLKGISYFLN
jgi:hypothetical protein